MTSGLWFTTECNSPTPLSLPYFIYSRVPEVQPRNQGRNIQYNNNGIKFVYKAEQNSLYRFVSWRAGWSDAWFCSSFITIMAEFPGRSRQNFPLKDLLGSPASSCFLLSVWRIAIVPRGSIMWACGLLNSSYRKDQLNLNVYCLSS